MGLSAAQFAENLTSNYGVHEPVDPTELPEDLANSMAATMSMSSEELLQGASRTRHDRFPLRA